MVENNLETQGTTGLMITPIMENQMEKQLENVMENNFLTTRMWVLQNNDATLCTMICPGTQMSKSKDHAAYDHDAKQIP